MLSNMNQGRKSVLTFLVITIICSMTWTTLLMTVFAAVPADTLRTTNAGVSTLVVDQLNVTDTYFFTWNGTTYNLTEVVAGLLGWNATDEWGLVYGTTGDWFNYTEITATPVYLGLQLHPLNVSVYGGELLLPEVYDKDATHWQLALYWAVNGTQYNKGDVLVMYYAHVEWDNEDGLEYLEPNEEPT